MNIAIVQARLGSSRFPEKVLALLNERTVIEHVLTRAKAIRGIDLVLAAIPHTDVRLEQAIRALGVFPVLGDELDVLGRFYSAVNGRGKIDAIMRITADCPAFDIATAERALETFLASESEYVSTETNVTPYPDGFDVEVFSLDALEQAYRNAGPHEREHVTTWMREHLRCTVVSPPVGWTYNGPHKLSLDTPEELPVIAAYLDAQSSRGGSPGRRRSAGENQKTGPVK